MGSELLNAEDLLRRLGLAIKRINELEAQVAALSKPVTYAELKPFEGGTLHIVERFNRIIAARLQPAPEEAK